MLCTMRYKHGTRRHLSLLKSRFGPVSEITLEANEGIQIDVDNLSIFPPLQSGVLPMQVHSQLLMQLNLDDTK